MSTDITYNVYANNTLYFIQSNRLKFSLTLYVIILVERDIYVFNRR